MANIVWSKVGCTYCDHAKRLLRTRGIPFEERQIGHGWTKADLVSAVPAARTVPQIFINDQHIGGYTDLVQHLKG
jgi:glutaredoxin 3